MNNPNPLIPQGSLLQQKAGSRPHLRIAIAIVAVHLVFLGGLLIQGCKKDDTLGKTGTSASESPLPPLTNANVYATTSGLAQTAPDLTTTSAPVAPSFPTTQALSQTPAIELPAATATREYVVLQGDSFYTIGKKFGVSSGAMAKANPGVDSTRLKIGQKLVIPAAPSPSVAAATTGNGGENVYVVKSGDTLSKIATAHHTTVNQIKALNGLKTDRIAAGEKLKLPAASSATAPATVTNLGTPTTPAPGGTGNL
jgi:peptidoglycan endopeptidase LytE